MTDERQSDDLSTHFEDAPWIARMLFVFVISCIDLVAKILRPWPMVVVFGIVMTSLVANQALLPENSRIGAGKALARIGEAGLSAASSGAFAIGGWMMSGLLLLVGVPACWMQHGRIRQQGDELALLRSQLDPDRVSSKQFAPKESKHGP